MLQEKTIGRTPDAWKRKVQIGSTACTIHCFPSNGNGTLSLTPYHEPDDVVQKPEQAARIGQHLASIKVNEAYAPSVSYMSATIGETRDLTTPVPLFGGPLLNRRRELPIEALPLRRGETGVMSVGGCRVAVAMGGDYCVMAHIGADSLMDRGRIAGLKNPGDPGQPTRDYESIIFAIQRFFGNHGVAESNIAIRCYLGLSEYGHHLAHKEWGEYNNKMVSDLINQWQRHTLEKIVTVTDNYANIDLFQLLRAQARSVGIRNVQDEKQIPPNGFFGNTRHPNEHMRSEMNLVAITRTA